MTIFPGKLNRADFISIAKKSLGSLGWTSRINEIVWLIPSETWGLITSLYTVTHEENSQFQSRNSAFQRKVWKTFCGSFLASCHLCKMERRKFLCDFCTLLGSSICFTIFHVISSSNSLEFDLESFGHLAGKNCKPNSFGIYLFLSNHSGISGHSPFW